jgi:hypothetical protein
MMLTHRYAVPSAWMRQQLAGLRVRLALGALNRCEHLRDGNATGPTVMALWSDAAVCFGCRRRLRLTGDADDTCDRCGALSRPTIWPHVVEAWPGHVVLFGLCHGCHGSEVAA